MLFNFRAAATAALALFAVPSFANPSAGDIINAINALKDKTSGLENSCSSVTQGSFTSGFSGFFSIGDTFTQVVAQARTTFQIIQSAQSISITYTEEESYEITQAWNDCLDVQNNLLVILKGGTDIFSQILQTILGAIQQLQGIFNDITNALGQICPPEKPKIVTQLWPPVDTSFNDCIDQFNKFGGGGGGGGSPGPFIPPNGGGAGGWGQDGNKKDNGWSQPPPPAWQPDGKHDDGSFDDGKHGKDDGWRRRRAFVA